MCQELESKEMADALIEMTKNTQLKMSTHGFCIFQWITGDLEKELAKI